MAIPRVRRIVVMVQGMMIKKASFHERGAGELGL